MTNEEVQAELKKAGFYDGPINGLVPAEDMNELLKSKNINGFMVWNFNRKLIATKQIILEEEGIEVGVVDGLIGPQTQYAITVHDSRKKEGVIPSSEETWRDKETAESKLLPKVDPTSQWPRQSDVPKVFGHVGSGQTTLILPYPLIIAWDKTKKINKMTLHTKVKESVDKILSTVLEHYGKDEIHRLRLDMFGGSLNVRKMRGGSSWSMHSWGIAFDFDPENNMLKVHKPKAEFSKDDYKFWFETWEAEGAVSLGRSRDYDWMHTQFARL